MARFVVGIGNRGVFPSRYMAEARQEMTEVLEGMEHDVLMMEEDATNHGAVETREEGDKFAQFLEKHKGKYDGIIWTHPNFGDERGMKRALQGLAKREEPLLLHAYPDNMDAMGPESRRDAFCGIISTMDVLYQMGVPFVKLPPHVVSPQSPAFVENIDLFAEICTWEAADPYEPLQPEPVSRGNNFLEGMVVLALGARTSPFYTTRFNEIDAQRNGITIETADLSELFDRMSNVTPSEDRYRKTEAELKGYTNWDRISSLALDQHVRLAAAIGEYIDELRPEAIAIRCWEEFQRIKGISPCAIISYLNNRGITTACEVDVGNAIAMAAMKRFSNDAVACQDWNNNWYDDPDKFMFMHCGPHDTAWLKEGHYVSSHAILGSVLGEGAGPGCLQGRFKPTVFTFASCASEEGYLRFYVGVGEVTDDKVPDDYFGSAGVARISGLQRVLQHVGYEGYKHHFSMTRGDVADEVIGALAQHPGYEVTDLRKAAQFCDL